MNQTPLSHAHKTWTAITILQAATLRSFFAGLLIPCGFAPIHMPGLAILGIALLFAQLRTQTIKQSFYTGFVFGLGYFGLGISWIYISINTYGHLNPALSACITLLFVAYLALFPALVCMTYRTLAKNDRFLFNCILFSGIWCLGEYLRATCLTGFPWLLLGVGQFDTPLKYLLPIIGVFGVSFITCLAATCLAISMHTDRATRYRWIMSCVALLITPLLLKNHAWTTIRSPSISVGIIQANISMRDKWDETLFWKILQHYEFETNKLIGKKQLILMPESAIPLPIHYVSDFLAALDMHAKEGGSAILFGIPAPTIANDTVYYNTLATLGSAQGSYLKQHLVPFGEFIPKPFQEISRRLNLPAANMTPGRRRQSHITVHNHPIASLICYEVAYPQLLRHQLPLAEWIVSISDDGWFGHSMAVYQQVQMSQVLSMQTGRFQMVANNDGLSSIINTQGDIVDSLPASSAGVLSASISPATGASPWVYWGDLPALLLSLGIALIGLLTVLRKRWFPSRER